MDAVNAISKVRFNSAKPQRVQLLQSESGQADLLCLEREQSTDLDGPGMLYVITGTATVTGSDAGETKLSSGFLGRCEGRCTLVNSSEQRLVCLAFRAEPQ